VRRESAGNPAAPLFFTLSKESFMFKPLALIATLCCTATLTLAQSPAPTTFPKEFPAEAQTPDAKALAGRLGDRVFKAAGPNGLGWRMDIKNSGFLFLDLSNGYRDDGPWRTEDGKLCVNYRGRIPAGCNEVRLVGDTVLLKTRAGEVVTLVAQ
jgi:hypothetical protein